MTNDGRHNLPAAQSALGALGTMLDAIAAFLGMCGLPVPSGIAGISGAATGAAQQYAERKMQQRIDRFTRLRQELERRLAELEEACSDEQFDLLLEVVRKALLDDEDEKSPIYAFVLEWILKDKPPVVHVRIVSDAVHSLSYLELYAFLLACRGQNVRPLVDRHLGEEIFWNRLAGSGLSGSGTIKRMGNPTILGRVLADGIDVEEMPEPK